MALISTVYNEGEDIFAWARSLRAQTRHPDEFVIVDGGSTDGTPGRLRQAFNHGDFPAPRIIVEKCNIARGRNLAIQNTTAEIIASTDAGSYPEPNWLEEITRPLLADEKLDVCGGKSRVLVKNDFQRFVEPFDTAGPEPVNGAPHGSSRNIAYRRRSWADVGGYPEWLTLTAEDALLNLQMHRVGKRFEYNPAAIVYWPMRETEAQYLKMLYNYGYGSAEARLFSMNYLRHLLVTLCPPLLLLSKHGFGCLRFRYLRNAACARGWLAGRLWGHRPPPGWKRWNGILLSPAAQLHL